MIISQNAELFRSSSGARNRKSFFWSMTLTNERSLTFQCLIWYQGWLVNFSPKMRLLSSRSRCYQLKLSLLTAERTSSKHYRAQLTVQTSVSFQTMWQFRFIFHLLNFYYLQINYMSIDLFSRADSASWLSARIVYFSLSVEALTTYWGNGTKACRT